MRRTPPVAGRGAVVRAGRALAAALVAVPPAARGVHGQTAAPPPPSVGPTSAPPAAAQPTPPPPSALDVPLALDAGVAYIRQAGTMGLAAPSVGAAWQAHAGRSTFQAAGVAAAADGRGSAQGAAEAARAFGPAGRPWSVDVATRAARVPNTPWSVLVLAGARQDVTWGRAAHGGPSAGSSGGPSGGAWARAQAGVARQAGRASPSVGGEAGVWRGAGAGARAALTFGAALARVAERGLVAAGVDAYGSVRVGVADAVASYERAAGRVELGVWAGARGYAPRGLRALPADDEDPTRPGPRCAGGRRRRRRGRCGCRTPSP
jgi:hypothetical protein